MDTRPVMIVFWPRIIRRAVPRATAAAPTLAAFFIRGAGGGR